MKEVLKTERSDSAVHARSKLAQIFSGKASIDLSTHSISTSSEEEGAIFFSSTNNSHAIDSNKSLAMAYHVRRLLFTAIKGLRTLRI